MENGQLNLKAATWSYKKKKINKIKNLPVVCMCNLEVVYFKRLISFQETWKV